MATAFFEAKAKGMPTESRKRPLEADQQTASASTKRPKLMSPYTILFAERPGSSPHHSFMETTDALAKAGLRRSIALVLQKVGFDTATPEAFESFVLMAEEYLTSMIEDVKHFTNAARRSYPIPTDFEQTLKRFNLTTSALKPHKKPPIPRSKRIPVYESLPGEDGIVPDLPILGPELDGAKDKASKPYIPASFPAFPSIHTYKYTPESVDAVTVSDDWGIFDPDAPLEPIEGSPVPQPQRPLAAEEIPHGDPKKIREAAAKEAKAGEEALRRLMRASKVAKQKEIRSAAQRQAARRDRYNLWEMAMKEMLEDGTKGKRREGGMICSLVNGDKNRVEIADHSMIVSTEKAYCRKEVPRPGVRKAVGNAAGKH